MCDGTKRRKIMQAVICDDEKSTCAELKEILTEYAASRDILLTVSVFYSGEELIEHLEKVETDILFLDIEPPGKDGVEIGKYIRTVLQNESIFLIYISSKTQYAMELFQNRPFHFLVKPLNREKIRSTLDNVFRLAGKNNDIFAYQNKQGCFQVKYKEILYFQSNGRVIYVVTEKGTGSFYGKLSQVAEKVPRELFLRIHKSYLINHTHVRRFAYDWVEMVNGDTLGISKANRVEIRRMIRENRND